MSDDERFSMGRGVSVLIWLLPALLAAIAGAWLIVSEGQTLSGLAMLGAGAAGLLIALNEANDQNPLLKIADQIWRPKPEAISVQPVAVVAAEQPRRMSDRTRRYVVWLAAGAVPIVLLLVLLSRFFGASDDRPRDAVASPIEVPAVSGELDLQRVRDLEVISMALVVYKDENGSYPFTAGNPQTACVYRESDVLCELEERLGPETLKDPSNGGYWYASDGERFALFVLLEDASLNQSCDSPFSQPPDQPAMACLTSP